jgi:glycosyltransferase involved in cell wall biosynthesis
MAGKLKIALTYISYPVAMARYFHEALLRRDDVDVWCAAPYTGRWIPWAGGMQLPERYLRKPDLPLAVSGVPTVSYPILENQKPWEPDLWLEVNAGLIGAGAPTSAPLALVLTDPHVLGKHYASCRPRANWVFCMQTPYMLLGDIWLPYAYDPIWHSETKIHARDRGFGAALLGLQYEQRTKLVQRLRSNGVKVEYELGLAYEDARAIYHNTVAGLNWSSLQDTTARVFELMAMGIAPVLNRVPDLMSMFEDRQDFLGFDTEDQAVSLVTELLDDLEFADWVGRCARKAVEPHSWDARVQQILEDTGLVTKDETATS